MNNPIGSGVFSIGLGICALIFAPSISASGSVKMNGSIIETACAIDVGSRDQTVDMGSLALTQIRRDGQGPTRPFVIRLMNCVLEQQDPNKPNWQYFRITFDGPHEKGLFGVSGQAKGVGLLIQRDNDGEIVIPGQGMSSNQLVEGNRELIYQLRLVANHRPLSSGQYYSQLRFKLDYE
ncbi:MULTISPECIES: fimbrial protein [Providencia]|uniref:Type 1 fimbrial protein n=2 Tax=Morganellaceae TaxID=1903414 RepID=A0AAI9MVJ6_PROST|nr:MULTISPECIES: fimbrial protein [Providencia]ELR5045942.1 type 1 fimbrial protein [Providencia rettgeri]MTB39603.1 fimbrial protein [Providencia sp. wls1949]MTC08478.1 fimbrial protein [Providencia sp. wls1948]ELR5034180.1 type 1 fimbrial protein [Providencia stuartii]ELR5121343.1 type 1 fimbrial protein [Providencia stuartii]